MDRTRPEQDASFFGKHLHDSKKEAAVVHKYPLSFPDDPATPIGSKSSDEDWDHIIRFCEQAGLRNTILRAMSEVDSDNQEEIHPDHIGDQIK